MGQANFDNLYLKEEDEKCFSKEVIKKIFHNAVIMVAGQLNGLESTSNDYSDIKSYLGDTTQGPQAVLNFILSLFVRNTMVGRTSNTDLKNSMYQDVLEEFAIGIKKKYYNHGYLELAKLDQAQLYQFYNHISPRLNKLKFAAQTDQVFTYNNVQEKISATQFISGAPSYQNFHNKQDQFNFDYLDTQISCHILAKQYKAFISTAIMKAYSSDDISYVPVHLTNIGSFSFRNSQYIYSSCYLQFCVFYELIKTKVDLNKFKLFFAEASQELLIPKIKELSKIDDINGQKQFTMMEENEKNKEIIKNVFFVEELFKGATDIYEELNIMYKKDNNLANDFLDLKNKYIKLKNITKKTMPEKKFSERLNESIERLEVLVRDMYTDNNFYICTVLNRLKNAIKEKTLTEEDADIFLNHIFIKCKLLKMYKTCLPHLIPKNKNIDALSLKGNPLKRNYRSRDNLNLSKMDKQLLQITQPWPIK